MRFWPGAENPTALFICSAIGIIPLAGLMGRATEALAARMGEGAGGLLNATFGNAAELIIAVVALSKGMSSVVKASITGSIIGNILLVFGLSILCGGTKYSEQRFNRTGARTSAISLSLAAIALIIPTVFHMAADLSPSGWSPIMEQRLSLAIALVLFLTYLCVLSFSLKTHRHFFQGTEGELEEKSEYWSRGKAIMVLLVATGFVALLAEFLVGTIESCTRDVRPHRDVRRYHRRRDYRQRRRALERHSYGVEKQNGSDCWDRDWIELADRTLCRAAAAIRLLFIW